MSEEFSGYTLVGSEPVYSIKLNLPYPYTMDTIDFKAVFYVSKSHTNIVPKEDMVRVSASEYTCKCNTTGMNRGPLNVEITATIGSGDEERSETILLRHIDMLY